MVSTLFFVVSLSPRHRRFSARKGVALRDRKTNRRAGFWIKNADSFSCFPAFQIPPRERVCRPCGTLAAGTRSPVLKRWAIEKNPAAQAEFEGRFTGVISSSPGVHARESWFSTAPIYCDCG